MLYRSSNWNNWEGGFKLGPIPNQVCLDSLNIAKSPQTATGPAFQQPGTAGWRAELGGLRPGGPCCFPLKRRRWATESGESMRRLLGRHWLAADCFKIAGGTMNWQQFSTAPTPGKPSSSDRQDFRSSVPARPCLVALTTAVGGRLPGVPTVCLRCRGSGSSRAIGEKERVRRIWPYLRGMIQKCMGLQPEKRPAPLAVGLAHLMVGRGHSMAHQTCPTDGRGSGRKVMWRFQSSSF